MTNRKFKKQAGSGLMIEYQITHENNGRIFYRGSKDRTLSGDMASASYALQVDEGEIQEVEGV